MRPPSLLTSRHFTCSRGKGTGFLALLLKLVTWLDRYAEVEKKVKRQQGGGAAASLWGSVDERATGFSWRWTRTDPPGGGERLTRVKV